MTGDGGLGSVSASVYDKQTPGSPAYSRGVYGVLAAAAEAPAGASGGLPAAGLVLVASVVREEPLEEELSEDELSEDELFEEEPLEEELLEDPPAPW